MSTEASIEVAEEALEKDVENLKISKSPQKKGKDAHKKHRPSAEEYLKQCEQKQNGLKILEQQVTGTVKWYSVLAHYGFIARDDGGKDVFIHQTGISKSRTEKPYLRTLGKDEKVVFDIVDGKEGPEAANLSGPDGGNVIGSKFFKMQFYKYRKGMLQHKKTEHNKEPVSENGKELERETEAVVDNGKTVSPSKKQAKRRNPRRRRNSEKAAQNAGGRRRRSTEVEEEKSASGDEPVPGTELAAGDGSTDADVPQSTGV